MIQEDEDPRAHVDIEHIKSAYPAIVRKYMDENTLDGNPFLKIDRIKCAKRPTLCNISDSGSIYMIHIGGRTFVIPRGQIHTLVVAAEMLKQGCWPDIPGILLTYHTARWMQVRDESGRRRQITAQLKCDEIRGHNPLQIIPLRLEACYRALQGYRRAISRIVGITIPPTLADIVASYAYLMIIDVDRKSSGVKAVVRMTCCLEMKEMFVPVCGTGDEPKWLENSDYYIAMATWWYSKQW